MAEAIHRSRNVVHSVTLVDLLWRDLFSSNSGGTAMDLSHSRFPADFRHLLDRICRDATELLHAQASSIFLRRPHDDIFVMRAARGYTHLLIDVAEYNVGEGITGWVAEGNTYKADSREQISADQRHIGKYDKAVWGGGAHQCRSMVAVPLSIGYQVYGLIKVENKLSGNAWAPFTNDDLESLSVFVRAISHAIESNDALMAVLGRLYVFVLMPFHEKFSNLFRLGIEPAVQKAGMRCERIDLLHFTDDIMQKIYDCIAHADIVVAVTTDKNPNVFYETGYSHALGKRTIPLAENADDIPFDLRHYPHIIYNPARLDLLSTLLFERLVGIRANALAASGQSPRPPRTKFKG